jgi:DNA polymerase-3 subunit alpha
LIKSGALDRYDERNRLFFNIETILEYHRRLANESSSGQTNLFGLSVQATLILKSAPKATQQEILHWEKELLGLYVSAHPFKEYGEKLQGLFIPIREIAQHKKEKSVRLAGMLTSCKKILTKNNEPMVFAKLEDGSGELEVVVFPRVYKEKIELWQEGDRAVFITGRPQEKEGEWKLLAETGYEITPDNLQQIIQYLRQEPMTDIAPSADAQSVTLSLRAQLPESILLKVRAVLDQYPGHYLVYFSIDQPQGRQRILSHYKIRFDELIAKELEELLGKDTVKAS